MTTERIIKVSAARGESFADIARRVGAVSGQPVAPTATDAQVLDAITAAANAAAEALIGPTYASTAAGLAATALGDAFAVDNGDGTVTIYLHDVGDVATPQRTLATTAYLSQTSGAAAIGADDGAAAAYFATVQGFIDKLRSASGTGILPFGSDQTYPDGSIPNELIPRVTLGLLPDVEPKDGKVAFVQDAGKEGFFKCFPGAAPVADLWGGLYVTSNTPTFYWARLWDRVAGRPEWFGVVPSDGSAAANNDVKIAAAYGMLPITQFGPFDYWTSDTIKANLNHHKIRGVGSRYNDVFGAMTRIVLNRGDVNIMQMGPDAYPGTINAMPQGIDVSDIFLARSVAPVINSNCTGLLMRWVLNAKAIDVKTDGNMYGFQETGTVHCHKIRCEAVRANAGSGVGTDFFVGHYANGVAGIGAAGGNASLYNIDCSAGCNYGPLQTATGSIGFLANQGFTDVWYWNPETTNFYMGQAVFGNDNPGLVFSNTDFLIEHPIHDQFTFAGLYVTDVATSGSVVTREAYFGPQAGARACYWVNSSEGAVKLDGGQFVMGGAPLVQPIILASSRGCDVIGYPIILEAGNNYPIVGVSDVQDARIEVFAKNPTVTAGAVVLFAGTCTNIQGAIKTSGKASAFQYGYQNTGTLVRSTLDVSGIDSTTLPAANRKLDNGGVAVVAAGAFGGTNLAQGNFN